MQNKPLMLMILDGWGLGPACAGNAITQANPCNFHSLFERYPHTTLVASGKAVGLPAGQMGNSEVGHLNIGAGRVVYQEITRISNAIETGQFCRNTELLSGLDRARRNQGAVHLMGLLSDGGVHSHIEHLFALLDLCRQQQINKVFIHAFLDGRDVGPKSAAEYIQQLQTYMNELGIGRIATLAGRFYAMDRDNRWERVEKAYQAMVAGQGRKAPGALAALEASYELRVTDEFVEPVVIIDENARSVGPICDGDTIVFFNFRADRAREITRAFIDQEFDHFPRGFRPDVHYVCMTQYDASFEVAVAFPPQNLNNTLGEVLAAEGLKQLRIAETEKYAHVTFFFNGGVEEPNEGEDRILIPSPAVDTYNLKPEMSAYEVTDRVLQELNREYYDVIILNYANPDMVGHTGIIEAAVKAVQTVDCCLVKVVERVLEKGGAVMITADHGNCEEMICNKTGGPITCHSTNEVPFILADAGHANSRLRQGGSLQDIAPTMLTLLGVDIPEEMTGTSLLLDRDR